MPTRPTEAMEHLERLRAELLEWRQPFEQLWRDVADYVTPRGRSMIGRETRRDENADQTARRQRMPNQTPALALRALSNGLFSGISDPADRWFRIEPAQKRLLDLDGVALWFDDVERGLYDLLAGSNFYVVVPIVFRELGAFGTAALLQLEDPDTVVRFELWPTGEYSVAVDRAGRVHRACRTMQMTLEDMADAFGLQALPPILRDRLDRGERHARIDVHYLIEPGDWWHDAGMLDRRWPVAGVHWLPGERRPLRVGGFHEMPLHVVRWERIPGTPWGYGPGIQAIGDAKQLQQLEKDKLAAIAKVVNPPLTGPGTLGIDQTAGFPGHFTPSSVVDAGAGAGLRPLYQINPDLAAITAEIRTVEQRILELFYADMFLQLAFLDRRQITAREIDERMAEKVQMIGPIVTGISRELLDPVITRTYDIVIRASQPFWPTAGIVPPPPAAIEGAGMAIRYVSPLHHAQRAQRVAAVGRFVQFVSGLSALDPDALMKLDGPQAVDEMASMLGVGPRILRSDQAVEEMREQRRQREAAAAALEQSRAAADVAQKIAPVVDRGGGGA